MISFTYFVRQMLIIMGVVWLEGEYWFRHWWWKTIWNWRSVKITFFTLRTEKLYWQQSIERHEEWKFYFVYLLKNRRIQDKNFYIYNKESFIVLLVYFCINLGRNWSKWEKYTYCAHYHGHLAPIVKYLPPFPQKSYSKWP